MAVIFFGEDMEEGAEIPASFVALIVGVLMIGFALGLVFGTGFQRIAQRAVDHNHQICLDEQKK